MAKETSEETAQQREAFLRHLDDASKVVETWEPWERNIFGDVEPSTVGEHSSNGNGCFEGNNSEE